MPTQAENLARLGVASSSVRLSYSLNLPESTILNGVPVRVSRRRHHFVLVAALADQPWPLFAVRHLYVEERQITTRLHVFHVPKDPEARSLERVHGVPAVRPLDPLKRSRHHFTLLGD